MFVKKEGGKKEKEKEKVIKREGWCEEGEEEKELIYRDWLRPD